jgi:hypothetical protein
MFAETFISCGGIEMLLFLLKEEAEAGDGTVLQQIKREMKMIE